MTNYFPYGKNLFEYFADPEDTLGARSAILEHYEDEDQTVCDSLDCGNVRRPVVLADRLIRPAEQLTRNS